MTNEYEDYKPDLDGLKNPETYFVRTESSDRYWKGELEKAIARIGLLSLGGADANIAHQMVEDLKSGIKQCSQTGALKLSESDLDIMNLVRDANSFAEHCETRSNEMNTKSFKAAA